MNSIPGIPTSFSYIIGSLSNNPANVGFAQVTIPATGDFLQVDPNTPTAYSGIQAAVSAHLSKENENLSEFGNGDVAVSTDSNGQRSTISEVNQGDHQEVYGLKAGTNGRVDLGDANSKATWDSAVQGGYSTQQGAQDLQTLKSQGLGGVSEVSAVLGFGTGSPGVQGAIGGLLDNAHAQVQKAGNNVPEGTLTRLNELDKVLGITRTIDSTITPHH
jgi:hypothetical protein